MSSLRKYILYSTIIGLFTDRFMLNVGPIHLLYFYALLLVNLALLTLEGALWIPGRLVGFLLYLAASGATGLLLGTGSVPGFAKDLIGIVPNAIYFAAFYRYMRFDVKECFALYARFALYLSIFGFLYLPFQPWGGGRLMSICQEPSSFCLLTVPAVFYYLDQWNRYRHGGWQCLTILGAIGLAESSLGLMGLLFGLYLFGTRYRHGLILAPVVVLAVFLGLYRSSEGFRLRTTDGLVGYSDNDVSKVNLSTFGLLANFFVTRHAFADNPILGGGLGSYIHLHEDYLESIPGIDLVLDEDRLHLGEWDASSLLLRVTAELGVTGLIAIAWYLISYFPRGSSPDERAIAMAALCYFFMKFARDGAYFNPEVFFFLSSYTVLGAVAHQKKKARELAANRARNAALGASSVLALPQESPA